MTVIKRLLEKRWATVGALHARVGGNKTMLYNAVGRRGRATKPLQERIASALEVPVEAIFDSDGWAKPAPEKK